MRCADDPLPWESTQANTGETTCKACIGETQTYLIEEASTPSKGVGKGAHELQSRSIATVVNGMAVGHDFNIVDAILFVELINKIRLEGLEMGIN